MAETFTLHLNIIVVKSFITMTPECATSKTSMPRKDFKGMTSGYQDQRIVTVRIFKLDT